VSRPVVSRAPLFAIASICVVLGSCANAFLWSLPGGASDPKPINLRDWELTLPVNTKGHLSGKAAVKRPAKLSPPWLTRQSDGGLLFWAPAGGATTPHSLHSRTELVSMRHFAAGEPGHELRASVVVKRLPSVSQTVIIGQVHGEGTYSAAAFMFLEIRSDSLRLSVESKPKPKGSLGPADGEVTTHYSLLKHVALDREFTYVIATTQDSVSVTTRFGSAAHPKGSAVSVSVPVPADWLGDAVRFSAGDYEQDDTSHANTGGGRVIFYNLAAS
jgi:hypothetical protein